MADDVVQKYSRRMSRLIAQTNRVRIIFNVVRHSVAGGGRFVMENPGIALGFSETIDRPRHGVADYVV